MITALTSQQWDELPHRQIVDVTPEDLEGFVVYASRVGDLGTYQDMLESASLQYADENVSVVGVDRVGSVVAFKTENQTTKYLHDKVLMISYANPEDVGDRPFSVENAITSGLVRFGKLGRYMSPAYYVSVS